MTAQIEDLLYNTDLDLSLSDIIKDNPSQLVVRSRFRPPRIILGLLFGLPCLILLVNALRHQGIYLLLSVVFCPPLAILGVLFGLTKQKKIFIPSMGKAVKSFQLLNMQRDMTVQLPKNGVLSTWKQWRTGGSEIGGGCYFYHVAIEGLKGFGFCIAKDENMRDEFARELATLLNYQIVDRGQKGGQP